MMSRTLESTNAPIDCSSSVVAAPAPSAARTKAGAPRTNAVNLLWFGASCSHGRHAANIAPLRSCITVGMTRWSLMRCCVNCETAFHQRASWPHAMVSSDDSLSSTRKRANAVRGSSATAGTSIGASESSGSAVKPATASHALNRSLGSGSCPAAVSECGNSSMREESVSEPSAAIRMSSPDAERACCSAGCRAARNSATVAAYGCVPAGIAASRAVANRSAFSPQARNDP